MGFGKHREMSLDQVIEECPKYCNWVLQETSSESQEGMKKLKAYLLLKIK